MNCLFLVRGDEDTETSDRSSQNSASSQNSTSSQDSVHSTCNTNRIIGFDALRYVQLYSFSKRLFHSQGLEYLVFVYVAYLLYDLSTLVFSRYASDNAGRQKAVELLNFCPQSKLVRRIVDSRNMLKIRRKAAKPLNYCFQSFFDSYTR